MRRFAHVVALVLVVAGLVGGRGVPLAHADGLPSITIGSASVIEGDTGSAVVNVPVDLSAPPTVKTTVQYWIHSTTATSGVDFVGTAGLLTFAVGGPVSKFISVTVYGDLSQEPDETVLVDLSMEKNATLASSEGTVTILDDDSDTNVGLQASIGDFSVYSATSGTHYADLPVTLSRPAPSTVKVTYSVTCTDAEDGVDYVFQSTGTLTFLAGVQTKQLQFQILPNQTDDGVKTILESIRVSTGPAATNDTSGQGAIVDTQGSSSSGGDLPPLPVGGIEQESVNSQGEAAQAPDPSVCDNSGVGSYGPSISADGRYVAFTSDAVNLVPNDNNGESDVFVRDRVTGAVERVSVASDGSPQMPPTSGSPYVEAFTAAISRDGRYVTFFDENSLGAYPGDQYFIHDRQTGTTVPLLLDMLGHPFYDQPSDPMLLSSDDRYLALTACGDSSPSGESPIVPVDPDPPKPPNGAQACDVFQLDRTTGVYTLVSNPSDGSASDGFFAGMSPNGRYVAFWSSNADYVAGDTNNCQDLFVRDMQNGTFERIDVTTAGEQALADTGGGCPGFRTDAALSDDGRYVAFSSSAWNLIGLPDGAANSQPEEMQLFNGLHMFVRDRVAGTTTMVDPGSADVWAYTPSISSDGRYVGYFCSPRSSSSTFCPAQTVYLITDLATGETVRADELPNGIQGDGGEPWLGATTQALSADGSYAVFASTSTNLTPNDDNSVDDVFVKRIH
jgi:Tol biopolymer transport system component